ncbi:MAG: M14 family metallopeptidase [Acidiferrobacteraceae bacterium]|jgi:murein tripeptide amidase MpaA
MVAKNFDHYPRYEELSRRLQEYAASRPELVRLESIGRSFEGRDIWLAIVTRFETGGDKDKPALWVDANLHSAELVGSVAALNLIDMLLQGHGSDPDITRCLDSRVFYICPRANPDGAEWALADTPRLVRSGTRRYPFEEDPAGGVATEDVDGDGRILSMRVPDPNGPWKICPEEPRLMVRRDPTETGGSYFRLLPEGRVDEYDGFTIALRPPAERLDFNRNFPSRWRGEHEQEGAGDYPSSEPEVRALTAFIAQHPNICGSVSLHSYSGVLLRPYSYRPDEDLPAEDRWIFERIGAEGTALTGYPAVSAYHEFRYHPQKIITGAMDDWMYEERGVYAWTMEIWSPQNQAGIGEYRFIDWYREHPLEDDLKLLYWSDQALKGEGYVDWYPFDHPELGKVELGGWNPLYSFWNPPPHLLKKEIDRLPRWLLWHNLISPRLELLRAESTALGNNHHQVRLAVQNTGWLPSDVTRHARDRKMVRGVVAEIGLPDNARLVAGSLRQQGGQLEGRAGKPSSPSGWAGQAADATDDRMVFEWIVHAPDGGTADLVARHERAGCVHAKIGLRA